MDLDRDLCDRCMAEWLPDDARVHGVSKAEILESLRRRGLVYCQAVSRRHRLEYFSGVPEGCPYALEHVLEAAR